MTLAKEIETGVEVAASAFRKRLETLTLDELVNEYQADIDELVALDRVPARPDDVAHHQKMNGLYASTGAYSMEMNKRARYKPEMAAVEAWDEDDTDDAAAEAR